jgi:hypothetical protein
VSKVNGFGFIIYSAAHLCTVVTYRKMKGRRAPHIFPSVNLPATMPYPKYSALLVQLHADAMITDAKGGIANGQKVRRNAGMCC